MDHSTDDSNSSNTVLLETLHSQKLTEEKTQASRTNAAAYDKVRLHQTLSGITVCVRVCPISNKQ